MLAATEIPSLDVIACFVHDRHSVLFRKREGCGKVRDFDETKVNSYVPKADRRVVRMRARSFDRIRGTSSKLTVREITVLVQRSDTLHVVDDCNWAV